MERDGMGQGPGVVKEGKDCAITDLMTGYDTDTPPLLHTPSPRCVDGGNLRVFCFFLFLLLFSFCLLPPF